MISKTISGVLVVVLLHGSVPAETQQQSPKQAVAKMQRVLHTAQEKDKAVKVTLQKEMDNRRTSIGKVIEITDAGFTLADKKTGRQ